MTVLIEVRSADGNARRCDASCHYAKSKKEKCTCVCQGKFHGIKSDAEQMPWESLHEVRSGLELESGESVQLRIGV